MSRLHLGVGGGGGEADNLTPEQNMDVPSDHFTHVLTNFALIPIPEPRACIAECFRVLRPSGTSAFTIWKRVGWYPSAVAAIARIPGAPLVPPFSEFGRVFLKDPQEGDDWTDMGFVERELRNAGFEDVQIVLHKNVVVLPSAEEYVKNYAAMTMTMLRNAWTEEEQGRVAPHFDAALLEELKSQFGDGEVLTEWEAWCVTARVPARKT